MHEDILRAPPPLLAPYLSELCAVRCAGAARASTILPAWTPAIFARATHDGRVRLFARGPSTRAGVFPADELAWAAGVELRVASVEALLGIPPADLVDAAAPLVDLWGDAARALEDELACSSTFDTRLDALEAAFTVRLRLMDRDDARVTRLVRCALGRLETGTPIGALAAELGVSARQLLRFFRDRVGISPKECAAILRLQRATDRLQDKRPSSLAEIAVSAGYYDQAHMNLEFRQRLGVSPGAWRARA